MSCYFWKWGFWVRVSGRLYYLAFNPNYEPLFSERNGYRKVYQFAGFVFKTEPLPNIDKDDVRQKARRKL